MVVYILVTYLLLFQDKTGEAKKKFNFFHKLIFGSVAGFISASMGIGGAIMNVPILKFVGYTINKAIGSAASIGFLISVFGSVGFLISGILIKTELP